MNQEENQQQEGNWGLPRGLYTQVKYYGIPIMKAFIIVGSFVFPLQFRDIFFPRGQELKFLINLLCTMTLTIYWMIPSSSGGNKFWEFIHAHRRTKKRYYPIDMNCYPELRDDGSKNRRYLMDKAAERLGRKYK